jgi:serine/threonine protein kinase/cytochrome c-type biogenesis protein CcmH/NrfG
MKTVDGVCEKCGAKILGDAPRGICPACLLETGLGLLEDDFVARGADPVRDSLVRPANRKKFARPASMLGNFSDYELLEEIGRGGQGAVYRAHQKSLNRTVALKVIGLSPWTTQAHLRRFRREAEAAASLEHPRIVPIYEVGERDVFCYFSMKFIEGGQLDEVIKHRPIPIRSAVELIAKLARTVHYAHERGILHRDIKPANILLDQEGEPHLTDFGLARLVETESTITRTREVIGTPSYMAPEQAAGEITQVNQSTDTYGLGAVLYQLLTGYPPFAGGTSYGTIQLLLDTEPRPPRVWNPKIDCDLSTICLKCLEKDQKRRYPSALALAEDLEHWLKHEPIHAKRSGVFTHARKWVRRNPAIAALIASLVALAAVMSWNVWKSELVSPLAPKGIAVLPFQNLSPDPDNAYFANGVQEEILTRLASIADLKVISRTSTQQYQNNPRNLIEIAKELGVANILEGSVQKVADQVRVTVQLVNAQNDSHLWAETYDRKLTDIFGIESEIAKGIVASLQAKLTGREAQALAVKPTDNPDAYDAYLRGLASEARSGYSTDPLRKAIGFYERAVQLDPKFALGWARLSRAEARSYFHAGDTTSGSPDAAKRALDNAQKLQPNAPDTQLALGWYQCYVLRDYGLAKTTFKEASKILPSSSEVPDALAAVARRLGNWDESITYLEQALALDPRNADLLGGLGFTYAVLRQFPEARKFYDRALDILPNDVDLMAVKATIYQAEGNLEKAAALLAKIDVQSPSYPFAARILQLTLERNPAEAIKLLQARKAQFFFGSDLENADNQTLLALAQRLAGDTNGAKASAEQARKLLKPLCKSQPDNLAFAQELSLANALLGDKDAALKEAERAIMLVPMTKDRTYGPSSEELLAIIQTIFGDNSRAISTLERLLQTPYSSTILYTPAPLTSALLKLDPTWDPLRGDPAFKKLCEEKQP